MNLDDGKLNYLTIACLNGYKINGGDISTMTPLQKSAMIIINEIILDWKIDGKALATI